VKQHNNKSTVDLEVLWITAETRKTFRTVDNNSQDWY